MSQTDYVICVIESTKLGSVVVKKLFNDWIYWKAANECDLTLLLGAQKDNVDDDMLLENGFHAMVSDFSIRIMLETYDEYCKVGISGLRECEGGKLGQIFRTIHIAEKDRAIPVKIVPKDYNTSTFPIVGPIRFIKRTDRSGQTNITQVTTTDPSYAQFVKDVDYKNYPKSKVKVNLNASMTESETSMTESPQRRGQKPSRLDSDDDTTSTKTMESTPVRRKRDSTTIESTDNYRTNSTTESRGRRSSTANSTGIDSITATLNRNMGKSQNSAKKNTVITFDEYVEEKVIERTPRQPRSRSSRDDDEINNRKAPPQNPRSRAVRGDEVEQRGRNSDSAPKSRAGRQSNEDEQPRQSGRVQTNRTRNDDNDNSLNNDRNNSQKSPKGILKDPLSAKNKGGTDSDDEKTAGRRDRRDTRNSQSDTKDSQRNVGSRDSRETQREVVQKGRRDQKDQKNDNKRTRDASPDDERRLYNNDERDYGRGNESYDDEGDYSQSGSEYSDYSGSDYSQSEYSDEEEETGDNLSSGRRSAGNSRR